MVTCSREALMQWRPIFGFRINKTLTAFLCLVWVPLCAGQSLNIDFGAADLGPPATYGGVGPAGHWNNLIAENGTVTPGLLALNGQETTVSVRQIGGVDNRWVDDPFVTGDHALLLNDYLITFHEVIETCLFFDGLQPGNYQVIIYARMPDQTSVFSFTNCDQEQGNPHYAVGGPWTGSHQEGVSYAVHFAEVGDEGLQVHSGIVPEADPQLGAALNGIQLILLDGCLADLTGPIGAPPDGVVDQFDLFFAVAAWATETSEADIADPDPSNPPGGDGLVNIFDLLEVLSLWGACP